MKMLLPIGDTAPKEEYGSIFPSVIDLDPPYSENQEKEESSFPKRGLSSLSTMSLRDILNNSGLLGLTSGDELCSSAHVGGSATLVNQSFNLIKNIVGCGVLSLPSGVAYLAKTNGVSTNNNSDNTSNGEQKALPNAIFGILLSSISLVFITGTIFGYYFIILGRICSLTSSSTFRGAWEKTVKHGTSLVILSNLLKPALGNLSLTIILTDTLQKLLQTAGFNTSRTAVLLLCTVLGLLPLCLIKSLATLAPFSIVGLMSMLATGIAMGIRYFDGSYDYGGKFVNDLSPQLRPSFEFGSPYTSQNGDSGDYLFSPQILVLACMLFEAFIAHYNAPRFYVELKHNTTKRFMMLSTISFLASSLFYAYIACVGFLTFGENADGYIINNYSTNDVIATICRVAIFIAVLLTYPIVFIGFRDGILDQFQVPTEKQTSGNLNIISVILLTIITLSAVFIKDLSVVNAVGGGTLGTLIVFVFPTLMFASAIKDNCAELTLSQKIEVWLVYGLMVLGVVMGFVGVLNTLLDIK